MGTICRERRRYAGKLPDITDVLNRTCQVKMSNTSLLGSSQKKRCTDFCRKSKSTQLPTASYSSVTDGNHSALFISVDSKFLRDSHGLTQKKVPARHFHSVRKYKSSSETIGRFCCSSSITFLPYGQSHSFNILHI